MTIARTESDKLSEIRRIFRQYTKAVTTCQRIEYRGVITDYFYQNGKLILTVVREGKTEQEVVEL